MPHPASSLAGRGTDMVCMSDDIRWRIDHHVATPGLAARARSAVVERAASHGERWSDHAPVTVVYS